MLYWFAPVARFRSRFRLFVTATLLLLASLAAAQSAVDGDSLELDGTTYRLHGIDAPDPDQICADGWPAGHAAEEYLGELIEGKEIACVT